MFLLVSYTALYLSLNEKRRGVTSRPLAGLDLLHQGRPEVCLHPRKIQVVEFSVSQYFKMLQQIGYYGTVNKRHWQIGGQRVKILSNLHVQTCRSKKVLRWGRAVS